MPRIPVPVQRIRSTALEVGVYFPLGLFSRARDEISGLDRAGLRSLFGDLVERGQQRAEPVERRLRRGGRRTVTTTKHAADEVKSATETAQRSTGRAATRTARKTRAAANASGPKLPRVSAPRSASELAISNYESLTVDEITSQLSGLTQTDLAKLYKYEKANDNRTTVLDAIEGRMVDLPIPTYDALTADEIVGRLESLDEGELKTVRRYEQDTKRRSTILERIDALV